jgi:hypothetical protein
LSGAGRSGVTNADLAVIAGTTGAGSSEAASFQDPWNMKDTLYSNYGNFLKRNYARDANFNGGEMMRLSLSPSDNFVLDEDVERCEAPAS